METGPQMRRVLGVFDLTLFNIAAVAGVRGFSGCAQAGARAIPMLALAALVFFLPSAFLFSRLGSRYPVEGGLYIWIREAFGERVAFLSAWIYSFANLLYFPIILVFAASIGPHVLGGRNAALADRGEFVLPAALLVLWTVTAANIFGLERAKWINNAGGLGTYTAFVLVLVFGIVLAHRYGSATPLAGWSSWNWTDLATWAQITFLLSGLEMAGLIGGEIRDPERTVPVAALISAVAVTVFYVSGTGALLALLPAREVHPLYGIAQAAGRAGALLHASWLAPLMAALVVCSTAGQFCATLSATSRLPWLFGIDRYLPASFGKLHSRYGTPYVSMLSGALVSTLILLGMFSGETLRAGFDTLYDATILANVAPLLFLYAAGWKLGCRISGGLGVLVSITGLICALIPTAEIHSVWIFELKAVGGVATIAAAGWLLYRRGARSEVKAQAAGL